MVTALHAQGANPVKYRFYTALTLITFITSSGCLKMGPDFHSPDTGIQIPDSYQHSDLITKTPLEEQWWHVFNNPELNQAVDEALRNNLDIRKATARVLEVQSQFVKV